MLHKDPKTKIYNIENNLVEFIEFTHKLNNLIIQLDVLQIKFINIIQI